MSKEGWTDGALWGVHYFAKGDVESLNQSAAEVLEVHIAQEAEQKLVALAGRGAAGRLFVQEMASDIVADVAMTCLRLIADDAEDFHFDNPDGVGHQIITKLMASTGLAQDVLTDWAIESPEKLKAAVQSMVGLADQVIQSSPSK